MIRRGEGCVSRLKGTVNKAFAAALADFVEKHGRGPEWDTLTFQGGFTSTKIIFEITEEADDGTDR